MPTRQDFKAYHESIAGELRVTKDRMRHLIGDRHWQSDGEHKEAILRKILRGHVAQSLEIGRGFVCGEGETSSQIDVLITRRDRPTLFRDGEMLLVTPDAVAAIIEVKTRIRDDLAEILEKLADNAAMIRGADPGRICPAGLFVYEALAGNDAHDRLLKQVQAASHGDPMRVIDWIAAGPSVFVRYWPNGNEVNSPVRGGPVWHSYTLEELSHAYFISNVVWDTAPRCDPAAQYAWFPVEGTKERHRKRSIAINQT
ncbi:MAG: hypothetical protein GX616_24235, partial [Planctomycetes bacterium]|nr:hypothetical protein [Planctomycetota bacterium]